MTPEEKLFWENRPPVALQALHDVMAERRRQMMVEGWTAKHDDEHTESEMALAAACYAMSAGGYAKGQTPPIWPWSFEWWKPAYGRRDLVRAAALLLAEIERIDRAAGKDDVALPVVCPECGAAEGRWHRPACSRPHGVREAEIELADMQQNGDSDDVLAAQINLENVRHAATQRARGMEGCHCKVCHSQKPEPHPPGPLYFPHIDGASGNAGGESS